MSNRLVSVYTAADVVQAELLRGELAERGIESWLSNEALVGAVGELPPGWPSSPRVLVAESDARKARDIAVAFDHRLVEVAHTSAGKFEPEDTGDAIDDEAYIRPRCPECGERRLAVCSICQTAGTDFPLAYAGTAEDAEVGVRVMVVCPTCDEPFYPRYYKLCEHCGYTFEDGVEIAQPRKLAEDMTNWRRARLVLGGIGVLTLVTAAYFWWVLS